MFYFEKHVYFTSRFDGFPAEGASADVTEPAEHAHGGGARFCERCGSPLSQKPIEGRVRAFCPVCDFVVYLDPKVAAGVIVTLEDRVVLLKRGIEPSIGKWVFPGGYVDLGEPTDVAAVREAQEEVGLEVVAEDLLGAFSYPGVQVVLVVYAGRVVGGRLKGNFETQEVRTYSPSEIPWSELAFQSTADALRVWMDRYGPQAGG